MSKKIKDLTETDFTIVNEDWSRYLVEDGTLIRVRIVVAKILRTAESDPMGYPNFSITSSNLVSAIVPPRLKSEPSKVAWNAKKDLGKEMKFEPMQENWQEYHTTEGFKILVKPVVTKVIGYMKYNIFGEPIYSLPHIQNILNVEKIKKDKSLS
jgi:hypothetical protein